MYEIKIMLRLGLRSGFTTTSAGTQTFSKRLHKRLLNVYITFTIVFRIGSECPFIERLVLVKTFS